MCMYIMYVCTRFAERACLSPSLFVSLSLCINMYIYIIYLYDDELPHGRSPELSKHFSDMFDDPPSTPAKMKESPFKSPIA